MEKIVRSINSSFVITATTSDEEIEAFADQIAEEHIAYHVAAYRNMHTICNGTVAEYEATEREAQLRERRSGFVRQLQAAREHTRMDEQKLAPRGTALGDAQRNEVVHALPTLPITKKPAFPEIKTQPDAIKMLAYNPLTRTVEEIAPDNQQVSVWDMIPLYWVPGLNRYVSIPGATGSSAYSEWLAQFIGRHEDDGDETPHPF